MFEIFGKRPLIVALSEKKDGTMRSVEKNRQKFLGKLGVDVNSVIRADLVQGNNVKVVSSQEAGKIIERTDGLLTADKNLFLTITVADCLPIFIYDPEKGVVGLIHGGWRNLAKNILTKAVENLSKSTLVGIGPGISQCHFEVKEDVLIEFKPYLKHTQRDNFLDLKKIAKIQLIHSGLKEKNIEISPECTFCLKDKYFSFRRDKFREVKTMLAVIGQIS